MRTVRSAAWSRNQPRRRVAWLLLVILLVLIALVARVDAAPGSASIELARRYADALTGAGQPAALDEEGDEDRDEDGNEEAEDRAAERPEIDDRENEEGNEEENKEEIAEREGSADGELAAASDEIALAGETLLGELGDAGESANLALGDDDARSILALGDDDGVAGSAGPGALAMLDAELAPGDATAGLDAADAGATAGAQEVYEQWMRHRRPSPWGRLDVGVSWRRRWSAPIHARAYRHDEIWLVATWRR